MQKLNGYKSHRKFVDHFEGSGEGVQRPYNSCVGVEKWTFMVMDYDYQMVQPRSRKWINSSSMGGGRERKKSGWWIILSELLIRKLFHSFQLFLLLLQRLSAEIRDRVLMCKRNICDKTWGNTNIRSIKSFSIFISNHGFQILVTAEQFPRIQQQMARVF